MIKIQIPKNNINERKYIIDVIFNEFLGLKYVLEINKNIKNYEIILESGRKLIIEDGFFNKFPKNLEYLKEENIPKKVEFVKNDFVIEKDIPIIYGTNKLKINKNSIICGIDIFASSFFMLTRWEEYVNKRRDKHNRFPAIESLAYKFNFLDRPVVNEYVEMLWNMLKFLGCKQKRKNWTFKYILTHDVDSVFKYRNRNIYWQIRGILSDVVKSKSLRLAIRNFKRQLKVILGKEKDPFDTYDYLMDISEQVGVKSYFFLHSSDASLRYDVNNDKFLKKLAKKVLKRGHYIGYHPSYDSYNNLELFLKDKEKIENLIEYPLKFGRQHYLRFEVPTTWQILEDAKMEWDSSLGYADKEGFRCGVCYTYSAFNILTRKKLNLKERPLIVMEGNLIDYQKLKPIEVETVIKSLIKKVKKYNGEFVFLWHNSSFNTYYWEKFKNIYGKVLIEDF